MPWVERFPGNFAWSNAALVTEAMVPYGAAALAEIDVVAKKLEPRQAEPEAWREEWCALGARIEPVDRLRAGMYWFTGERFVYPGEEKRALGRKALELQHAGLAERHPGIERVEVPYEGATLPALFMKSG